MEGFGASFGPGEFDGSTYGDGAVFGMGVNDDVFGGGGFLNAGGMGMGEFGGGYLMESSQRGQGGSSYDKSASRNTLIPMKIGHLYRSWLNGPPTSTITPFYKPSNVPNDPNFHPPLFPPQLHLIRIVGIIRKISKGGESDGWDLGDGVMERISLTVEDGSGCIDCQLVIPEDLSPWKKNNLKALLIPEQYIKVYGSVVLLGQRFPHIHVHALRPITSADDIFFHDSDCMYTAVLYKYGPGNGEMNNYTSFVTSNSSFQH